MTIARAKLIEAQTAGEWQKVRALKLLVNRLEYDMRRVRQEE